MEYKNKIFSDLIRHSHILISPGCKKSLGRYKNTRRAQAQIASQGRAGGILSNYLTAPLPPSLLCSLHTTMLINTQTAQNSFTDSLWHFVKIFASQEIKLFPNCIIIFACRLELRGRKRIKSAINQSINAALLRPGKHHFSHFKT